MTQEPAVQGLAKSVRGNHGMCGTGRLYLGFSDLFSPHATVDLKKYKRSSVTAHEGVENRQPQPCSFLSRGSGEWTDGMIFGGGLGCGF